MRKKRNTKSRAIRPADIAVIFACLLGTAACLGLFQADLNRSIHKLSENPVGSVAFKSRAALRRFQDRIIWDRLRRESPVYNGDFIRTAEGAGTTIRFSGGEQVNLSENSLIRISVEAGKPLIEFSRGNISVYAGEAESLVVSFGENRIRAAAGSAVNLNTGSGGEGTFGLEVIEGSASLITPAEEQEAAAGTAILFDGGGIAGDGGLQETSRIAVFTPPPAARFLTPVNTSAPVEFTLAAGAFSEEGRPAPSPPGGGVRIEIAGDRNFTRPLMVLEQNASGTDSAVLTADVPAGTWWWRAYPAGGDPGRAEKKGQFTVSWTPPPRTVSPAPASVYYYQTDPPELRFQWEAPEEVLYFILEAADNPAMANPVLQEDVRSKSLVYSRLGEGQWYWRVTPVFPAFYRGTILPSPAVPFTVSRLEPSPPVRTAGTVETAADPSETALTTAAGSPLAVTEPAELVEPPPMPVASTPQAATPTTLRATAAPSAAPQQPPAAPAAAVETPAVRTAPPAAAAPTTPRATATPAPLPAITGRIPANDYVISPETLQASRTIAFNWDPVAGADAYIFTLLHENALGVRRPVANVETSNPSYTLADLSLLDQGRFIWQVEAVSRGPGGTIERRGIPGENRFTVDIPQPKTPRGRDVGTLYGR
jgi:hypothetical protein